MTMNGNYKCGDIFIPYTAITWYSRDREEIHKKALRFKKSSHLCYMLSAFLIGQLKLVSNSPDLIHECI